MCYVRWRCSKNSYWFVVIVVRLCVGICLSLWRRSYMEYCTHNPDIHACGFKIMFNMFNNRISDDALDYMLKKPSLKIICLARRNVYEQTLSFLYKSFLSKHHQKPNCTSHEKGGRDNCTSADTFNVTKAVRGWPVTHCTESAPGCLIAAAILHERSGSSDTLRHSEFLWTIVGHWHRLLTSLQLSESFSTYMLNGE